ncbi:hypothetical protein FEM48_Zijuj02G0028400 [Ziziphus jujuba var. spinosa]|uniref:Uncharacterized protein n=2 Tax=Ziziphus jujuba TaxID=326968 RepID=A0A978VT67_ZIZJJ|nr:hypothetical protein FEM48_Zijuj02G0028400 [Ziziphus jujuba var. spinosa]
MIKSNSEGALTDEVAYELDQEEDLENRNSFSAIRHYMQISLKRMTEPPFRPREKLIEKQRYFQNLHRHTYLKGPFDKITSVAIPLALAGSSLFLIGRGIYNMSHGIGKKE